MTIMRQEWQIIFLKIKKKIKNQKIFKQIFHDFFLFIYFWPQICVQGPYLMRIDNLYLVGKI